MNRRQFLKGLGAGMLALAPCIGACKLLAEKVATSAWSGVGFAPTQIQSFSVGYALSGGVVTVYSGSMPSDANSPSGKCLFTMKVQG